jgi:voltage-gated potassium channel
VHEDPALHDRLEASRIHQAKSVIILSNERCQDPDAQSALIALAISKVCGTKRPHIIAETLNHRKIHHLKDAGVNETICATDYGIGLMAQSALHPRLRLTKVYDNLLSYSKETNEFYLIKKEDIPSLLKTTKTTFSKISEILNKKRNSENPVLLVGIMREGEPVINPMKGQDEIRENDDLVVLAYNPPDLSDME